MVKRRLVLRLSSLGDIVLATSFLEASRSNMDWVIAREFVELIQGHPKIDQVFEFDRSSGFKGWVQFSRKLWDNRYDEIIDLHRSLRTQIMKLLFIYWDLTEKTPRPTWKSISKQRFRLYSYFLFKKLWPKRWRPTPWSERFARVSEDFGSSSNPKPNLQHLIKDQSLPKELSHDLKNKGKLDYICVMPSSRWDGKKWPIEYYVELLKKQTCFPVILGGSKDQEGIELSQRLSELGISHFSAVGIWNLRQVARVLSESKAYVGGDTGLAHLAEAVGVSAKVIYGPTVSDMGFGPWKGESRSIGLELWCRPCGKDGRYCYRLGQKHLCLKGLSSKTVLENLGID